MVASLRTPLRVFEWLALVVLVLMLFCYELLPATSSFVQAASNSFTIRIVGPTKPPGFFPTLVTVHEGEPIVFMNDATPPTTYKLVANDGSFSSPPIAPRQSWSISFQKAAVHEYHISTLSHKMVGEIVVVPPTVELLPTPDPAAEATAFADIRANKQPPTLDATGSQGGIQLEEIAIIVVVCLLVIGASIGGFFVYRHRRVSS
jgi:plastocyanin